MKVAHPSCSSKPISEDSAVASKPFQAIDGLVDQLKQTVEKAADGGDSFDSVERRVRESVAQIGFEFMELFLKLQGFGDLGPEITTEDQKTLRRSEEPVTTAIRSIFGSHQFKQFTYARGQKKSVELRPISARMSLPAERWSFLLQEFSQILAVDSSYGQAMEVLGKILGGGAYSVDTAEKTNLKLGQAAGEFLGDLPTPEPESEAKLLVASADCKGVPLVKQDAPKVAAFESAKKRPGNRRMATVSSVYSVEPHVRTAEDITAALFREEPDEEAEKVVRPRPQNKNTTAHFPEVDDDGEGGEFRISGIHVAMAWIMGQIIARRRPGQVLVVLMDGQPSLWETLTLHLSFDTKTVPILDIIHALSYVWEAAGLFEKQQGPRKAFTRKRLLRILRGEVKGVIRGLRQLGTRAGLTGEDAKDLRRICRYLENNADRMRYDEYLRRGYPIATGVIEGACRHLVKDRMERSGMRWTLEGARSMLNVRAAFQSDHWQALHDNRIATEVKQTHPHQYLVRDYQANTLVC